MAETAIRRVRVVVRGVVQGVYYRASTRAQAERLRLHGWVRNTRDGAVEMEVEGPADGVVQLLTWCHQGPPAARVEHVEVEECPSRGASSGFAIRY